MFLSTIIFGCCLSTHHHTFHTLSFLHVPNHIHIMNLYNNTSKIYTQTSSPTVYYWAVLCAYVSGSMERKMHTLKLQCEHNCNLPYIAIACHAVKSVSQSIFRLDDWDDCLASRPTYRTVLFSQPQENGSTGLFVCVLHCSSTQYLDYSNHQPSSCHHTLIQSFCHHSLYKHQPNCHQPSALACHIQNVKSSVSY